MVSSEDENGRRPDEGLRSPQIYPNGVIYRSPGLYSTLGIENEKPDTPTGFDRDVTPLE